ncbi:MAG: hypothetical protein JEZ07_13780 [Phycisphaerae bacterium]|nr:hypothetical protein [Phycisphaerae bacterium]
MAKGMSWTFAIVVILLLTNDLFAQQQWPTVGIEGAVEVVYGTDELMARGGQEKAPLLLRLASVKEEDGKCIYDFRYIGMVPGECDLADYIINHDGQRPADLESIEIQVLALLPEDQSDLIAKQLSDIALPGGYKIFMICIWAIWALMLVPLVYVGRKHKEPVVIEVETEPDLADILRPLVAGAIEGNLGIEGKVRLEKLLVYYWSLKLGIEVDDVYEALVQIKADGQAGVLLRSLESWLHRKPADGAVDINEMLEPYRNVRFEFDVS